MSMLFFRSEEDLDAWLDSRNTSRGAAFTVPQLWMLSQRWYSNRILPDYHGRTMDQVQEIFKENGLTSEFWQV